MLHTFRMYSVISDKAILNLLCIISAAEIMELASDGIVYIMTVSMLSCLRLFKQILIRNPCSDFLEKHINPQNSKMHHVSKNGSSFKFSYIQAVTSQIIKPNCNLFFFSLPWDRNNPRREQRKS